MTDNDRGDQQQIMDAEAVRARKELEPNIGTWTAPDVIRWWNRWYLKAGHKRLGRALVDLAKQLDKSSASAPQD